MHARSDEVQVVMISLFLTKLVLNKAEHLESLSKNSLFLQKLLLLVLHLLLEVSTALLLLVLSPKLVVIRIVTHYSYQVWMVAVLRVEFVVGDE